MTQIALGPRFAKVSSVTSERPRCIEGYHISKDVWEASVWELLSTWDTFGMVSFCSLWQVWKLANYEKCPNYGMFSYPVWFVWVSNLKYLLYSIAMFWLTTSKQITWHICGEYTSVCIQIQQIFRHTHYTIPHWRWVEPHQLIPVVEFQECSTYMRQEATVMCLYADIAT